MTLLVVFGLPTKNCSVLLTFCFVMYVACNQSICHHLCIMFVSCFIYIKFNSYHLIIFGLLLVVAVNKLINFSVSRKKALIFHLDVKSLFKY